LPTRSDGFSLIETLIAAVILFFTVAVVSQIFGSSAKRILFLRHQLKRLPRLQVFCFNILTDLQEEDISYRIEEKSLSLKLVMNGEEKGETEVEARYAVPEGCDECLPLLVKIEVGRDKLKELISGE